MDPNCLGIVDFVHGVPLTFARQIGRREQVASGAVVIAQSGGLASIVRAALTAKGVAVICTVSTGNEAVLGLEDYAAYLLEIRQPRWLLPSPSRFESRSAFSRWRHGLASSASLSSCCCRDIVLPPANSAKSHTGALAGDYAVIEALLRHNCVMLVQSLEELFDVAELALRFPAPPSKGLAMVTDSGAIKGLALDYCETLGLDLPPLPPDLGATIQAELPDFVDASNPLDLTAQAITHPEMYKRTIKPLLADDAYGSLLLAVIIGEASDFAVAKGKACLEPLMGSPKPAILGLLGDEVNVPASIISDARAAGIPFFRSPERALRALARLTAYGRSLKRARHASGRAADLGAAFDRTTYAHRIREQIVSRQAWDPDPKGRAGRQSPRCLGSRGRNRISGGAQASGPGAAA